MREVLQTGSIDVSEALREPVLESGEDPAGRGVHGIGSEQLDARKATRCEVAKKVGHPRSPP